MNEEYNCIKKLTILKKYKYDRPNYPTFWDF